jgi:hypothetical protein
VSQGGTQAIAVAPGLTRQRTLSVTRSREMRGEILACAVGFGLVALLMCAAHVRRGGFYYDDWSLVALGRFPGAGGLLHSLWLDYGQRPGQVLYYAALDEAFGAAARPRLALAAGITQVVAAAVPSVHELPVAAVRPRVKDQLRPGPRPPRQGRAPEDGRAGVVAVIQQDPAVQERVPAHRQLAHAARTE